ncbi:MAG: glutaredoxin [Endozoicomonas sp. (ex Botrylloides leachii)]|nr:glutaredoxin [Endozoicomonas sp. (ex Botrylloides leachii)]
MKSVNMTLFRWAGKWGPFKVNIPCGECALTEAVIDDTLNNELADVPVELEVKDWLSCWWQPLSKGCWHAPIVIVENKVVSQGQALNRGLLTQVVIESHSRKVPLTGNHIFGKKNCAHCRRTKDYFEKAGIEYRYHDVISDARALYEMLARVKPNIHPKVPVTVPQIWLDGTYIGGADKLNMVI